MILPKLCQKMTLGDSGLKGSNYVHTQGVLQGTGGPDPSLWTWFDFKSVNRNQHKYVLCLREPQGKFDYQAYHSQNFKSICNPLSHITVSIIWLIGEFYNYCSDQQTSRIKKSHPMRLAFRVILLTASVLTHLFSWKKWTKQTQNRSPRRDQFVL